MFENQQIALIEGKCRRFRNSFDCLKTYVHKTVCDIYHNNVPVVPDY